MAYSYVRIVSIMCTDKQDLLLVKFHLNRSEFCCIFAADTFGFTLLFTFYCNVVTKLFMCWDMFNHKSIITIFSFRYMYQEPWAVICSCQPLCYTYWWFFSSLQSQFQNCSTETWRNILCYGGKHGECCVLVCTQEKDFFSITREKKLNIFW